MRRLSFVLAVIVASCQPMLAPENSNQTPSGDSPLVAPLDPAYALLVPGDTTFWVVKGRETDVVMRFRGGGDPLLQFHLGANSLARRPDGSVIEPGDSLRITIRPNGEKMEFEFEPSGLVFSSDAAPVLHLWCTHAADDLNGDGVVDRTDEHLWYQMKIWKREAASDPWEVQPTTRSSDGAELETTVPGFTGFSVAS